MWTSLTSVHLLARTASHYDLYKSGFNETQTEMRENVSLELEKGQLSPKIKVTLWWLYLIWVCLHIYLHKCGDFCFFSRNILGICITNKNSLNWTSLFFSQRFITYLKLSLPYSWWTLKLKPCPTNKRQGLQQFSPTDPRKMTQWEKESLRVHSW